MTVDVSQFLEIGAFAEQLVGQALWPHQLAFARSDARYRVVCAGRQVGKSRGLAIIALHAAATRRNYSVLLVSAGEVASRRLLAECATLATSSPLLAGSVLDESKGSLTLSNGSVIRSVPPSQQQIRGWPVDLLIVDEAGFIDTEVWRAAEPAIIARPGSRVILASTPWGSTEHFFRLLWHRGMRSPDGQVAAWHWPSSVSPMVDDVLLEQIREREAPHYFAREYLAEWTDDVGAFFTSVELENATKDYGLLPPEEAVAHGVVQVVGGVDWGSRNDANTLVVLGSSSPPYDERGRLRYRVLWLEEHHRMSYDVWIDRLVEVAGMYPFGALAAETNGVGDYPTLQLSQLLAQRGHHVVVPVQTTAKLKQDGFGLVQLLMQQDRLELPPHPGLLRQLSALEFERTESGLMRIAVPDRVGHDDLAMALCLAVLQLGRNELPLPPAAAWDEDDWLEVDDEMRIGGGW
ncbi:terminase family protein [Blastococcus colisei]|uniref:Terminase family protein n=1 Tax=Blastococcus colisei TaxID=1564162 RepID=A0A543PJZ9_9ACTN|nr:terminase family protein [Blastococcus colisei]TQN44402.1 terminase family protein [Blastococcus colisei]